MTSTAATRACPQQNRHRGLRLGAIATGLAMLAASLIGIGASPAHASDSSSLVSMTNSARSSHGLKRYATSSALASVALKQAKRMAASGRLFHNPNLSSDVSGWQHVGENVGYGGSASSIFNALMNSAPHRANILDRDYTQIGVGAVRDGKGRLWIAQVFRDPIGSSSSSGSSGTTKTVTKKKTVAKKSSSVKTRSSNAQAPRSTPRATPKATTPKATPKPAVTTPAPTPTIEQRIAGLKKWQGSRPEGDPVADAIDFSRAMATLSP